MNYEHPFNSPVQIDINTWTSLCPSNLDEQFFKCNICKFSTEDVKKFGFHLKNVHDEILYSFAKNPYACDKCNFRCKGKKSFVKHVKKECKHPFRCNECNKTFKVKNMFNEHNFIFHQIGARNNETHWSR